MLRLLIVFVLIPSLPGTQQSVRKPYTLQQVWNLDATYTDAQHGVSFRYPAVWRPTNQYGYHAPALTQSQTNPPIAGFAYGEGGFPRTGTIGPYARTNLEGFGIVYSLLPATGDAGCQAKAKALAMDSAASPATIGGRSYSVYKTSDAGMSQSISGHLYATYESGSCYLFETGVAEVNIAVVDNIQELTPAQRRSIETHLQGIVQTIRIDSHPESK